MGEGMGYRRSAARAALLASVSALGGGLTLGLATAASAQDAAAGQVDEVVVTGTRRAGVTLTESSTPVDVVSGETLQRQGASDLNDALKTTVVSLNVQKFVAQDASAFVRPFSLRGLPPDQTLVLVNGKRRHRSAVVQITNQPLAAGAQGPDLSAIPAIAVDRIEVLRDGAAAQYGSDAIAGVINFQLKRAREGVTAIARYGQFYEGDGEDYNLQLNVGLRLGEEGFFNVSGELSSSAKTSRGLQRPDAQALINAGNTAVPDPAQRWGAPSVDAARLFFNAELPATATATAYAFGNFGQASAESDFFYRPLNRADVFASVPLTNQPGGPRFSFTSRFPGGFAPVFRSNMLDMGLTGGVKGEAFGGLRYDFSAGLAQNEIEFKLDNTVNPSLGPDSPASFRAGELQQREARLNADFVYPVDTGMFAEPLNVAFGAEYRRETFEIKAGEPASYQAGRFASLADPDTGRIIGLAVGSSGFPGYTPASAGAFSRSNWAAYLDLETEVVDRLTVGAAARYEDFSDFGSTFNWKLTARYELFDGLALRGSVNTGFRAPTPGQSNISDVATNIDPLTGGLLLIATRPPTDPIAQYYGAKPLKEEESKNFAFGAVLDVAGWVLTADYFNIEVKDRIALTSRIPITAADRAALAARGTPAGDLQSVRFFGNFFDTETEGVDVVLSRSWPLDIGKIGLTAAANYTRSKVTNLRDARAVDRERRIEIGRFNPRWRGNVTGTWESGRWNVLLRANYYGEWVDAVPNATPTALSFDQDFGAEWLVDAEVSYQATETFSIAVGADNLLDAYPDKDRRQAQINNGIVYPQFSPFGFNGGFWYVRLTGKF
jgi:iron complex outermembrane receptor protein